MKRVREHSVNTVSDKLADCPVQHAGARLTVVAMWPPDTRFVIDLLLRITLSAHRDLGACVP